MIIGSSVGFELRVIDEIERVKIETFVEETCGCTKVNGGPCSNVLAEKFPVIRAQCAEMDRASLDYVLLGELMASASTVIHRGHPSKERERFSYTYYHEGVKVYLVFTLNFISIIIRYVRKAFCFCMESKKIGSKYFKKATQFKVLMHGFMVI